MIRKVILLFSNSGGNHDAQTAPAEILSVLTAVSLLFMCGLLTFGQERFNEELLKNFTFRNLGPFRAGSWVTSFAVPASPLKEHLYTFYVGTRNGGLWKTVNAGTTFEPVFDGQPKLSIGAVAVAPSDSKIVWVGTGEPIAPEAQLGDGSISPLMPARPGATRA
jgi:hypothetical protein